MSGDQSVRARIARGGLLLDGATGTELERRSVKTGLPLWSAAALLDCPEVVAAIHQDYVAAGADIVVANTFRTNVRTLRRAGRASAGPDLNRLAVELVRRAATAAAREILVAASVAPVEDCYRPDLVPEESVLRQEHAEMMRWLQAAGPDLVWIETMSTVGESQAAAAAAAERGLPFAVSFVVAETGDLLSGERLEDAVTAVEAFAPVAVGLNCIPPRGMTALLPRLRVATARPLAAYAHINNAVPIHGWSYSQAVSPVDYAGFARQWVALGASVVGGCCGTTPAHIRALREMV